MFYLAMTTLCFALDFLQATVFSNLRAGSIVQG